MNLPFEANIQRPVGRILHTYNDQSITKTLFLVFYFSRSARLIQLSRGLYSGMLLLFLQDCWWYLKGVQIYFSQNSFLKKYCLFIFKIDVHYCGTHSNTKYIALDPSALLYYVFYRDTNARDELAELGDAAGTVAHRHFELD